MIAGVFQQQLVHVRNGCVSDDPDHLPYVRVGSTNFHNSGHLLNHYQSLRGTSKVEVVHSVLDRTFYSTHGICTEGVNKYIIFNLHYLQASGSE